MSLGFLCLPLQPFTDTISLVRCVSQHVRCLRPLILRDPCGADTETEVGSLPRGDTDGMWLRPRLESRLTPKLLCFPASLPGSHHPRPCGQSGACPTCVNTYTRHPRAFVIFRATPACFLVLESALWPPQAL